MIDQIYLAYSNDRATYNVFEDGALTGKGLESRRA